MVEKGGESDARSAEDSAVPRTAKMFVHSEDSCSVKHISTTFKRKGLARVNESLIVTICF
jgi:hypothetical protein